MVLAMAMGASARADAETLRVGAECTAYPFNYRQPDGSFAGYDVDVANELGKRLGQEVKIVCQQWDGMIPALLAGKFDAIIASMGITEERKKRIDFSVPYRTSTGQFVASKQKASTYFDASGAINKEAFAGVRVGVVRATTFDRWLEANLPGATIVRYDGHEPQFLDLKSGRVDAVMTSPMKAYDAFLKGEGGAAFELAGNEIVDLALFGPGCGVGLRKGSDELRQKIDGAIADMITDGTLDKFSKKYFPFAIYPTAG